MNNRPPRIPKIEQLKNAVAEIGGEMLAGSGFEDEAAEPDFSDSVPDPRQPDVP